MTPHSHHISRRTALGILGGAAVALGAGGLALLRRDGGDGDGDAPVEAPGLADGLRAIGARYVALHPDDADPAALASALGTSREDLVAAPGEALRARRATIEAEHAVGEIVDVDGWVLARTECRIAALLTLA
jgi:hypothetical protein